MAIDTIIDRHTVSKIFTLFLSTLNSLKQPLKPVVQLQLRVYSLHKYRETSTHVLIEPGAPMYIQCLQYLRYQHMIIYLQSQNTH